MEKLTLQNPITINGKKVKTLTYDTDAITVGMFADAEARKLRATSNKGGGSAGACELDYSLHAYLAMMAIVAVNRPAKKGYLKLRPNSSTWVSGVPFSQRVSMFTRMSAHLL